MSPSPQLAPAGSSSYTSNTMTVGDGTWDATRNIFLLPNLVGLNLATTQYNGMGNRFAQLPQYHNLIRAHGVIAAITFLAIVPAAIMIVRFYGRNPRMALRYHIWLQILTVLLTTVIFVLGWFAVGPSRSLTNPHHGIGLAIYVLVLFQAIGGWWVHSSEKMKRRMYEPLKVMSHHWVGRMIALLGLAQIPLGLTLYGSPLALFVLYALAVFALLVIYFILSHIRDRRIGIDYDSQYSHSTGSVVEEGHLRRTDGRRRSGRGKVVKGAIAGAGLYALVDRYRNRRSQNRSERPEVVASRAGSHRHSGSYVGDERDYGREGGWEDRLLRIAEAIGLGGLVWRMLDRKHRDRDSDVGDYGPSLAGATEINQGRIGGGRPPPGGPIPFNQPLPGNQHPLNQPLSPGQRPLSHPASELSHSSFLSASGEPRRGNGLRDGIATLGFFELVRRIFNRRQGRNEDQHLQEEQNAQVQGRHLTGDGRPLRQHRPGLSSISSDTTSLTGASHPQHVNNIPPVPAGIYPEGAGGAAVTANERNRSRNEELPLGGVPRSGQLAMPPIPPDTQGIFHANSSGSEVYIGDDGRNHWRHRDAAAGGIAGGAAGVGAAEAAGASSGRRNRRDRRQSVTGGENNMASPPVSVKVKLHDGGRHVTLRRLSEAEAAAERKARQLSRERTGRNKGDSVSSLSGTSGGQERFRRNQFQERQQAEAMRIESERLAAARTRAQNQNSPLNVPQPAPIPESSSSLRPPVTASVGSPGTYDGNTTDGGASADYANNRRRRRAERAQAKQVREARGGKTVEFE